VDKDQQYININGNRFVADKEFIPLIKELNKLGLETTQHCSGHGCKDSYITIKLTNQCDFWFRNIDCVPRLNIRWNRQGKELYSGKKN
jgi:hypothetical protein